MIQSTRCQARSPTTGNEGEPTALQPQPRLQRCWPLANNAGGVVVFNLTTDQRAFEARIWSSSALSIQDAIQCPEHDATVQLCLEVDAINPNNPTAKLLLHTKDDIRLMQPTQGRPGRVVPAMSPDKLPPTRTYWMSFDRWNQCIKYGRGYHMKETTELTWDFLKDGRCQLTTGEAEELFGPGVKLASLDITKWVGSHLPGQGGGSGMNVGDAAAVVEFDPLPLVKNPPALVKDSSQVTLEDMNNPEYTFSADLPAACQVLYKNIAGLQLEKRLAEAIKHSIETEGLTLYKKLWEKRFKKPWTEDDRGKPIDTGGGDDVEFPYLRVTLGEELGDGPGIPYVLEIWPGKIGRSPIHNHGNVCAVIKVLHGSIKVAIFNKMELKAKKGVDPSRVSLLDKEPEPQPLLILPRLKKGDVTWMSPHWYQCHRLDNTESKGLGDYCATIQCYKYDDHDLVRWTGFDYMDGNDILLFKPDSDFSYWDMKNKVLEEYEARQAGLKTL